jgi:formylglycine-generating enzyme required for sulfatase activity
MMNIWQGQFPKQNTSLDGFPTTAPVGSFPPNGYGLLDMAGNVWEWVADWYSGGYYEVSPQFDPPGPADGSFKIIRGGSWFVSASNLRSSFRGAYWPGGQLGDTGFRVARDAPERRAPFDRQKARRREQPALAAVMS